MQRIVVFSGAGVSAESGLQTFRGSGGLWHSVRIEDVATPEAWARNPQKVLEFYNRRRAALAESAPNLAHRAIAELETAYEVTVVTQNVDDLHEKAGSTGVIHLHGQLAEARSERDAKYVQPYPVGGLSLEDRCPRGGRMRPNVVWFGEEVPNYALGAAVIARADKLLVVGTSLTVYPAAGLVHEAVGARERILVGLEHESVPDGFDFLEGPAGERVPELIARWLAEA